MKADTLVAPPTGTSTASTTTVPVSNPPTTDYLKPVLTPANAGGLAASGPGGPPPPGPELALNVECGPNKAWFYVGRLCQGSKGPCVLFNGAWLTPNEFQYVSGRETAKDWKRSIRHHGKSMKLLMTKGILAISPPTCQCDVCTGCAENNNNLDVNKRAAEIAARKAASEAAAGIDATGKTTSISELTSGMADNSAVAVDDRLADVDGGSDQNSPAKESRLTNIIEAIKSKKKKDDGTLDSASQKENRPNSRPSSRSGTKKKKDHLTENGVASPDDGSAQNSPVSMATLDIMQVQRTDVTLYPTVAAPAAPDMHRSPEVSNEPAAAESDAESDIEPCDDVIPDDVSRTRAYDWSARQAKKVAPEMRPTEGSAHAQVAAATDAPSASPSVSRMEVAPSTSPAPPAISSLTNHIRSLASRDMGDAGSSEVSSLSPGRRMSPSMAGRWSPSTSLPKVPSGTDSKPPLLSANRSITTATSCITKPIVSTGTAMFTSALPKDQREGSNSNSSSSNRDGKDSREESSKVYAPINWPPVASEVSSEVKATETKVSTNSESRTSESSSSSSSLKVAESSSKVSSEVRSSSDRHTTPEKDKSVSSEERGRPSPPTPKVGAKASEVSTSSNYSEYLRHLGRVPGAPPPGMDDESYIAMMRRYYEWYELTRLYGPYALPPGAPPPSSPALPRSTLPPHHPGAYDQHSLLSSMYHPYYYQHPAAAGDPYRAMGATSLPQEWARLSALTEQEREALLARQRGAEAESDASTAATSGSSSSSSAQSGSLKRAFPGEMSREEALDLSVNKKQKLAESLAARDSAALLYGLHGFRHPHFAAMGTPATGYPAGVGSLELAAAAAYPGIWGLPHSHPGASLSHAIPTTGATLPHPGLAAYVSHPLAGGSRPSTTASTVTSSAASTIHKELLHAAHRPEGPTLGLAGAWR